MRGYIVSRSKSYPSVVHPTDSLMNVNRGPPCDSRASFTRRRRRYGRDLQLLSTSEIFDKFCLQRLQWSKKWAVPASCISWRSRGNRGPQTPDKKRCSYKAINCLRCGVSLRMEQRGCLAIQWNNSKIAYWRFVCKWLEIMVACVDLRHLQRDLIASCEYVAS